ncbi:EAL domain-containing protein [Methylovulum miyakonense]|uniref:EAL domain-containing protein n=1 Tax=Methylovulum miyakonense TaxID=645578 RepID=UPI0003724874|nr:EAL domain-containing protein [Methylovulum miyakonense]
MPLQQLVNHFNDRFENEHHSSLHPFILENNRVSGLFGPIRISSTFTPVRSAENLDLLTGHIAQLSVAPYDDFLHAPNASQQSLVDFQSIINLDRLSRTVHMLNYLPFSHLGGVLFLDVDPRHVVGVSSNHGAYFEEVIGKCGLATKNVVISVALNNFYALHHDEILEGLQNYRQRGYQVAVNIGHLYTANGLVDLITKLSPDFLRVNAPGSGQGDLDVQITWPSALSSLKELADLVGAQTVLQQVDEKEQAFIVSSMGFSLVQGRYYDLLSVDHLRCL